MLAERLGYFRLGPVSRVTFSPDQAEALARYVLVPSSSGGKIIRRVEDLQGLTVARVAMLERGSVGAAVLSDPAMTLFMRRHPQTATFADVRTREGVRQVYGTDSYVSATLISRRPWLQANQDLAGRLARAVNHSLGWLHSHSIEEITKLTTGTAEGK